MVYRRMLPRSQQHLDNRECHNRDQGATPGAKLLVAGDLNMNMSEPEGDQQGEEIVAALNRVGLEDMLAHFLPRRRPWCQDGRTWIMVQEWREVRSRTDYILGTDHRLFWNVSVRDPRHNSDHYLVLGCLRGDPLREHYEYLGRRKRLPLRAPTTPTREDRLFAALRRAAPKYKARDTQKTRGSWRPRGYSSTRESTHAGTLRGTRH